MKLSAQLSGLESFTRNFTRTAESVSARAAEAAADALANELERSKETEGISAPLIREQAASRHSIGVNGAEAIDRELGTLTQEPSPWLAPVLPAARGPMRAAAQAAVSRAISTRLRKR